MAKKKGPIEKAMESWEKAQRQGSLGAGVIDDPWHEMAHEKYDEYHRLFDPLNKPYDQQRNMYTQRALSQLNSMKRRKELSIEDKFEKQRNEPYRYYADLKAIEERHEREIEEFKAQQKAQLEWEKDLAISQDSAIELLKDPTVKVKNKWKQQNVEVLRSEQVSNLFLHGNLIASVDWDQRKLTITDSGWPTPTTRRYLNAILKTAGLGSEIQIYKKKGAQWIQVGNDREEWTLVSTTVNLPTEFEDEY